MNQILQFLQPYSEYIGYLIAIVALTLPLFRAVKSQYSANSIAGLVLTIGIFGTFLGVLIGLSAFNLQDESIGIQNLINSLKLAFITSVSGMLSNLFIRFRVPFWRWPLEDSTEKEPVDLLINEVSKMTRAIAGDSDSSLLTQIVRMRTEFSDATKHMTVEVSDAVLSLRDEMLSEQVKLRNSFDGFASKMIENNQKALIEALNEIIQDFNNQLSEQLGGNFKLLDESVGKLNEWQKLYAEKTAIASEKLVEVASSLEGLSPVIENTASSVEKWTSAQNEFGKTVENVADGIKYLVDTSQTISQGVPKILDELNGVSDQIKEVLENQEESSQEMIREIANKQKEVLASFSKNIDEMIAEANKQIIDYREKTDKELEKTIESLGSGMISMSQAFVEKYGNLKEVIQNLDKELVTLRNKNR